jgi:hypothetical protein
LHYHPEDLTYRRRIAFLEASREFLETLDQLDTSVSQTSGMPGGTLNVIAIETLTLTTPIQYSIPGGADVQM